MEYSLSKTINKNIVKEEVFETLTEKLKAVCTSSEQGDSLSIEGFGDQLGAVNYSVKAIFSIKDKKDKTVINVNVTQKPTWVFWVLLVVLLFTTGFLAFIPVAFYFYGKKQVTDKIHASLLETAEELG